MYSAEFGDPLTFPSMAPVAQLQARLVIWAGYKTVGKAGQIPSGTCVGWNYREQKYAAQKFTVITKLLFYSHHTPTCKQADLTSLAGAEKDLLWYLLFVERDQQARTGSQRSSPDRQELK